MINNTLITSLDVIDEDLSIRSTFESGTIRTHPRFTKGRTSFIVKYDVLGISDFNALLDEYNVYKTDGVTSFTNPDTGVTHLVRFTEPISYKISGMVVRSVMIQLQEV